MYKKMRSGLMRTVLWFDASAADLLVTHRTVNALGWPDLCTQPVARNAGKHACCYGDCARWAGC